MASTRTLVAAAVAVLCVVASTAEFVPMHAKLGGMTESCRTRGLPAPCSVACSMSARLCRACCAAVATFTAAPDVTGVTGVTNNVGASSTEASASVAPLPSDEEILTKGISKSANCLALCSSFPAKRIRTILQDPKANEADLKELAKQMAALNEELPWATILENANSRPATISVLCENGKLSC